MCVDDAARMQYANCGAAPTFVCACRGCRPGRPQLINPPGLDVALDKFGRSEIVSDTEPDR